MFHPLYKYCVDVRDSLGVYVANRVADKIVPLFDHIWVCRSGSAADTQALADYAKYYLSQHSADIGRAPSVHTAATLLSKMAYENKDNLMAGMIIAGIDPETGLKKKKMKMKMDRQSLFFSYSSFSSLSLSPPFLVNVCNAMYLICHFLVQTLYR